MSEQPGGAVVTARKTYTVAVNPRNLHPALLALVEEFQDAVLGLAVAAEPMARAAQELQVSILQARLEGAALVYRAVTGDESLERLPIRVAAGIGGMDEFVATARAFQRERLGAR